MQKKPSRRGRRASEVMPCNEVVWFKIGTSIGLLIGMALFWAVRELRRGK